MPVIVLSFIRHAKQEIGFRKSVDAGYDISPNNVLEDTIETCLTIARREKNPTDETKGNFKRLEKESDHLAQATSCKVILE